MPEIIKINLSLKTSGSVIYDFEKFKKRLNDADEVFNQFKNKYGKNIQKDDVLLILISGFSTIEKYGLLAKTLRFIEEIKNSLEKEALPIPMIIIAMLDLSFTAFIVYSTVPEIEEYKFYTMKKILSCLPNNSETINK